MADVPKWLWQTARWGFGLALVGVTVFALALTQGLADPPHAGPLMWENEFTDNVARWDFLAPEGGALTPGGNGLLAEFTAPEQLLFGVTADPGGDFTLETGGVQIAGETGAALGVVFGWQDATHYSVVLINSNGYAEAYRQMGEAQHVWVAWGQWPHILALPESNRVRVDVRGDTLTARVNDELLFETAIQPGAARGRVGVVGRGVGAGKLVFSWARLWASNK